MKHILQFKILLVMLMLPIIASATVLNKDKHNKTKTIRKEFSVKPNATVKIENSYGNLDIVTWNENRVVFEVTITTSGSNEEKVADKLKEIGIDFSASADLVTAQTEFSRSNKSWWNWTSKSKVNMKVNYLVKIPITNNVNLNNDYGNINLEKLVGSATISCDYGKITTKELMASNNNLNFDYTRGCYFEYINAGKINCDYSDFTIAKAKNIQLNADYTSAKIEIAENVSYNCDYGNIKIDKVNNVKGNGDYLTTIIGDVYKDVSIVADYGSLKINNIKSNAGNIDIDGDYVGLKIGYASGYNFNFDIQLDYASLSGKNDLIFTYKTEKSTDKHYKGYRGTNNSRNNIKVRSDYGSLTLFKN